MKPTAVATRSNEIPDALLAELRQNLVARCVASGIELLDSNSHLFDTLDPAQPNAARFVGYAAQWVDVGYREEDLIEKLLARFPKTVRSRLAISDYLHLRMAEGVLAMAHDKPDDSLFQFDLVLSMQDEIDDKEQVAIARFWKARCHRRKGEYDEALKHTAIAWKLAHDLGFMKMAAVMRVMESWILFQKGHRRDATRVLEQAEVALRDSDDHITLGNIYSAHGRMIRRQGRYNDALKYFAKAIDHYQKLSLQHRNLARSLVNIAYVQRLVAQQIARQIDAEADERRRSQGSSSEKSGKKKRELYEQLRADGFANLDEAERIYRHHEHHHGIGSVFENRSLLYLDSGELDSAADQAAGAYELGRQENDSILIARSRLLQCMIENERLEEGLEGSWEHAQSARDYVREAVDAAKHTQNNRLIARAYIWRGLTSCNQFFKDIEDAKACCDAATSLLKSVDYDDLAEELHRLRQKVMPKGNIDPLLRSWSQGITGEKTFQEMTEQFAELVIPRVWEQEGRKVSRVATRLSISPKKVRRILGRLGKLRKTDSQ
ncbi:MAG TPA: tetratricopeptide repeat protein [Terriglobales bacterium]